MQNLSRNFILGSKLTKISCTLCKDLSRFFTCRNISSPLNIVVQHTILLYGWQWHVHQQHTEIIAFELKEWFREDPVMSCYKHTASLFVVKFLSNKHSCSLDKTKISWNIPAAGAFKMLSSKVSAFFINCEIAIQAAKYALCYLSFSQKFPWRFKPSAMLLIIDS